LKAAASPAHFGAPEATAIMRAVRGALDRECGIAAVVAETTVTSRGKPGSSAAGPRGESPWDSTASMKLVAMRRRPSKAPCTTRAPIESPPGFLL
jgi:hypothetical protein